MTPQEALQRIIDNREIFHDEMVALMRLIMAGEVSNVMIAAILAGVTGMVIFGPALVYRLTGYAVGF